MRAYQIITENDISVHDNGNISELISHIDNDEDLYRRQFLPIIINLKKKIAKGSYDHELAPKLWQYLVDNAAKDYVKKHGAKGQDVKDIFPRPMRQDIAKVLADREWQRIRDGEYNEIN